MLSYIGSLIVLAPVVSLIAILIDRTITHRVREPIIKKCLIISQITSILAGFICAGYVVLGGIEIDTIAFDLVSLSTSELTFALRIDRLSAAFVVITCILGSVVGLFASRYLHRDPGYLRFFILYHIFLVGVHAIFQGAGLTTVYIGWELIGISSALLISFFSFRKQTVTNSLRAFWAYRITDCGILIATLLAMHHGIDHFSNRGQHLSPNLLVVIGCLISAVGKSAQFPFGRWLPKAMEGPTPSSAIFYGGLSVHAGVYLMLRVAEVYGLPTPVAVSMVIIGILSVCYANVVGRIQSDVKSMLAYASMAQVGFMFIEVALGFHGLAIFHFVSHALLRTYQLLNAASVLHDRYAFEHVLGRERSSPSGTQGRPVFSRYSYAFWESIDGTFGRLSILSFIDLLARSCRDLERLLENAILSLSRYLVFYRIF